jgi:hypothetical protein
LNESSEKLELSDGTDKVSNLESKIWRFEVQFDAAENSIFGSAMVDPYRREMVKPDSAGVDMLTLPIGVQA